jgi:hypothetical protein
MNHDILGTALLYVVLGAGLLAILKFALLEAGAFWKWLRTEWWRSL